MLTMISKKRQNTFKFVRVHDWFCSLIAKTKLVGFVNSYATRTYDEDLVFSDELEGKNLKI